MKRERTSIQNLIVASEATDQGPGLVNSGFSHCEVSLNAPMAGESPALGKDKRGDHPPDKLHINNGEIKTEIETNTSGLLTPNSPRMSQHSAGSSLPFAAFEMPETTVIPAHNSMTNSAHKRKSNLQIQEAIPIMPLPVAVVCLVLNVIIPGSGTMLSGFIAFFLSRKELSSYDRTMILCTNCFVGLVQLATVVFLFIGWFWSVTWGCAFVGLSSQYSKRVADENENGGIA